jgi:hypothetical protein
MDFNKEVNEVIDAIASLNHRFPDSVVGKGIEKEVVITVGVLNNEIKQLFYEIRGNWDSKYGVEKAIEEIIKRKAVELKVPIVTSPL